MQLGVLACVALLATYLAIAPADAALRIGIAAPLTGPRAWAGEQTRAGAEAAVEDLNSRGGVLGESLLTVLADDFCDPAQAEAAAQKLIADGVIAVVGHQCSGAALAASRIYESAGILFISPKATSPQLTERGHKLTFRTCGRDDVQASMVADYIAEKWSKGVVALIHDGQAYGQGLAVEVKRRLGELGIGIALYEQVEPGQVDFSELVTAMETNAVSVAFYSGYQAEAGLIARQAKERLPNLHFIVPDAVAYEDFWLIAGSAAEGTKMTQLMNPARYPPGAAVASKLVAGGTDPIGATLYAYAAVQAWAQAATVAGTAEPRRVGAVLRSERFDTVLGRIGFDDKGDVVGINSFAWYIWRGGKYIESSDVDLE